jgi:hypothetical protein
MSKIKSALSLAKWFKVAGRVLAVVDVLGFVADIGLWIYDAVANAQAEGKLKDYIRDLNVARFAALQLSMINKVWENSENDIKTAITVWIDQQNDADAGVPSMCYKEHHNEILAEKLDTIFESLVGNLSLVTNETIWSALQKKDQDRIALGIDDWLSDDLSFTQTVNAVYQATGDDGNGAVPTSNYEYTPGQPVQPLPASQINGTNCAYAELSGGKGAIWKIFGYFWSYQQVSTVANKPGIRHRLAEKSRTATTVLLQLVTSNGVAVANGPELTLDTSTNELRWANGTIIALDSASKMNLVPTNGWTLFKAYASPGSAYDWVNNTGECNRATGWTVEFNPGTPTEAGLQEATRNKDFVATTKWRAVPPGSPIPPVKAYPQVELNLTAGTMRTTWDADPTYGFFIQPLDMSLLFPRIGID